MAPAPGDAARGPPLRAARRSLAARRGSSWACTSSLLAVRGNAREIDLLLTAVPRDVLLAIQSSLPALATARIIQGSPTDLSDLTARPTRVWSVSPARAPSDCVS